MKESRETLLNLVGTNDDIGIKLAKWVDCELALKEKVVTSEPSYPKEKIREIQMLIDQYCPGVNDEIRSFAKELEISIEQVLFYGMSYLEKGCSLIACLPRKTISKRTLMARNYDFNDTMEEMCFSYTAVKGKYAYIGSTLNLFGRSDGLNEKGLAICKASNGLPVGNFFGAQKANVTGFSFWIMVRSILENCQNVVEGIEWILQAPIAYNFNVLLADKANRIALVECIDGHKDYTILTEEDSADFLSCTNHTTLDSLKIYEKLKISNSVIRNNRINELLCSKARITKEQLKNILTVSYPEGLCCHYYEAYFGTLRSMVIDVTEGSIDVSFGSPQANKWQKFFVEKLDEKTVAVCLPQEPMPENFYEVL